MLIKTHLPTGRRLIESKDGRVWIDHRGDSVTHFEVGDEVSFSIPSGLMWKYSYLLLPQSEYSWSTVYGKVISAPDSSNDVVVKMSDATSAELTFDQYRYLKDHPDMGRCLNLRSKVELPEIKSSMTRDERIFHNMVEFIKGRGNANQDFNSEIYKNLLAYFTPELQVISGFMIVTDAEVAFSSKVYSIYNKKVNKITKESTSRYIYDLELLLETLSKDEI